MPLPLCYRCSSQPCSCRDGVTLYHAYDSLALLPKLPDGIADAIITDPPYSSGGFTRSDRNQSVAAKYQQTGTIRTYASFSGDNRDSRSWGYWSALWIGECLRLIRDAGYVLMFSDWRQLPTATDAMQAGGTCWRGIIAWDKTECARSVSTGWFRHQCEYIVWGTKGTTQPAEHGGPWPGCYRVPVLQSDKHHLTGKPTELMRRLIQCVCPGGLILDPFAGSGTTGVSAALEGRRAILIEREEMNCEIAAERLRQGVLI